MAEYLSSHGKMKKVGIHLGVDENEIEACRTDNTEIWVASHSMLNKWHNRFMDNNQNFEQLYDALQDVLNHRSMTKLDKKIKESLETEVSFAMDCESGASLLPL